YNAQSTSSPDPFSTNFGSITVTCAGATCGTGNASWSIAGSTLQLAITQTAPTPGSTFNVFGLAAFSGGVSLTNGVLGGGITGLTFGSTSITNNTSNPKITYALDGIFTSINSNQNGAVTTINGTVTVPNPVPEPNGLVLMAVGLITFFVLPRQK